MLNSKTQNIFCCVNENLTTFYKLWQGDKKTEGEKKISVYKSWMLLKRNLGFSIYYLVLFIWLQ